MSYSNDPVIHYSVNKTSWKRHTNKNGDYMWASERTAQRMLTRAVNAGEIKAGEWQVMSVDAFAKAEPMVEVKSVMTGNPVMIRASARGSRASDPSMEGYWTL